MVSLRVMRTGLQILSHLLHRTVGNLLSKNTKNDFMHFYPCKALSSFRSHQTLAQSARTTNSRKGGRGHCTFCTVSLLLQKFLVHVLWACNSPTDHDLDMKYILCALRTLYEIRKGSVQGFQLHVRKNVQNWAASMHTQTKRTFIYSWTCKKAKVLPPHRTSRTCERESQFNDLWLWWFHHRAVVVIWDGQWPSKLLRSR